MGQEETTNLLDFSYLNSISYGDQAFVEEMLRLFIDTVPNEIMIIQKAIAEQDFATAHRLVHSIKSSVKFIGFRKAVALQLELEKAIKSGADLPLIGRLFNDYQSLLQLAITEVQKSLAEMQQKAIG